jgi:hypothetical protein
MADYSPDTDPRSSNSLIRAYLASKQMQPGNPNYAQAVRTALSANAANPGTIPGLMNSTPSTEADDQAAMAAARHGIGGNSGAVARAAPPARPELPDSAPGSETRVGGTGGGTGAGGNTSAPPTGDELSNALVAAAIASGAGGAGLLMNQLWKNRSPSASATAPPVAGVEGPGGQFELPLEGGKGTAPLRQGELPLQGGPRVNQPELPLSGGSGAQQGDLFGPRVAPGPAAPVPPITVHTSPQPITSVEQFTAANPGASIPAPDPAVVPPPPQVTDTVPENRPTVRARKPRVPKVRL